MNNEPIPRPKMGRTSKKTPATVKMLVKAIGRGLPFSHACSMAGISFETFSKWRSNDEQFRAQIEKAVSNGISKRLKIIEEASLGAAGSRPDWRAAAWLLEKCHGSSEHFSKTRLQVEAVGAVAHSFVIPQETLDQIAEARARYEQQLQQPKPGE